MTTPTIEQMDAYQGAFDYFNGALFAGELPPVILNFSRSGSRTVAFFARKRWEKDARRDDQVLDEISLTPKFLNVPSIEIMQSLVHEMCHQWQYEFGKPSLRSYHNREWAEKMLEVGLKPVNAKGGMTGQNVWDEVIPAGAFERAFGKMPAKLNLPWRVFVEADKPANGGDAGGEGEGEGEAAAPAPKPTRVKFHCSGCEANAWGKPTLHLICGDCGTAFEPAA